MLVFCPCPGPVRDLDGTWTGPGPGPGPGPELDNNYETVFYQNCSKRFIEKARTDNNSSFNKCLS